MSEFRKSPWQRLTEYLPGKPKFWHIILLLNPYGRYWLHQDEKSVKSEDTKHKE